MADGGLNMRIARCSSIDIDLNSLPEEASQVLQEELARLEDPVYVASDSPVNPKLPIAYAMGDHSTVGADYVARCVNAIVAAGARPVYFRSSLRRGQDFSACRDAVLEGIAAGCRRSGCGFVQGKLQDVDEEHYLLGGTIVGVAERSHLMVKNTVSAGDILIGLSSSGVHASGFDVIERVFDLSPESLTAYNRELGCSLGAELLKPTRVYTASILQMVVSGIGIKAVCNVDDGGILGCLPGILKDGVTAVISTGSYPMHNIFELIQTRSGLSDEEMFRTFNMGIGMIIAVAREDVGRAVEAIVRCGERPFIIGHCIEGTRGVDLT